MTPVDLRGPLPQGTVVLEASAGTGKTWTIAGYVARYVGEGVARLDQLLVVTFGRAATSELRTRVRERLVDVRAALLAGGPSEDPVVLHLAATQPEAVARLTAALADFDAATVATTHEFCQQVLRSLGTAADLDPGTVLVEDLRDLVAEVADDLYLRFFARADAGEPPFTRAQAHDLARTVTLSDRDAVLLPQATEPDSDADLRKRFAGKVREELEARMRTLRLLGFEDLLTRVRDALQHEVSGPVARARLRARFQVVLVDEFQDTDPVQWDVLREAFHGHATLVVIGDPKQAIYAFRGADVRAYLSARELADERCTLDTNFRSDPALLGGLATLLRGAALGDPRIVVRPVRAGHTSPGLRPSEETGQLEPGPVRLRVLAPESLLVPDPKMLVGSTRPAIAADVVAQVRATLEEKLLVGRGARTRPLVASDVAVLVRTSAQAATVRDALRAAGVPAVVTGTSSVFRTDAAADWQVLLEALEQPHRTGRVRRLAMTLFLGWSADRLDTGAADSSEPVRSTAQADVDALALRVRDWAQVLADRGVAALATAVTEQEGTTPRLLSQPGGERVVTDLRHVAEALHAAALAEQLGVSGLLAWLRRRVAEAAQEGSQERSRRLESGAAAVQVLTVHTSKGLEFPVVLVPYGWDAAAGPKDKIPRGHDEHGRRTVFVGGPRAAGYEQACAQLAEDEAGEELRLLYVAVTRAASRLLLWWCPGRKTPDSPLHRLLFCEDPSAVPTSVTVPPGPKALAHLRSLGLPVTVIAPPVAVAPAPAPAPVGPLLLSELTRPVDTGWRRTSYTGLTRDAGHVPARVGSEPEAAGTEDEPEDLGAGTGAAARSSHDVAPVPSPMADLPGGAGFGTLVHAVLEEADLSGDAEQGLRAAAVPALQRHGGGALTAEVLAAALLPAVSTPLGPLLDGLRWRDVPPSDLLPELDFELPLAGGDVPTAPLRLAALAALLREHLPAHDPVLPWADRLQDPALGEQWLRGYLGGSLDAVVRVGPPHARRYLVVDHKTNRLAPSDVPLTSWHYRREALDEAVREAHYPLQALLYLVALHRWLRWRHPGYLPEEHLGGVLYLFLRGMVGEGAQEPSGHVPGVWSWRPPAALVVAVSDLLAGTP